jgi:serine/threonine-protein kinase HipA
MDRFFDHVVFSWIVGNGDMHAKNIAVLRSIKPGALGSGPQIQGTRYSPLYDLVNTSLIIPGDLFALPINGKQNNLRRKDFSALAKLWGAGRDTASARIESLATSIRQKLSATLELSHLPESMKERYQRTVDQAIDGL